jgi:hypothetical protein
MNKKASVLVVGLLTVALLATTILDVSATESLFVSGSWTITPVAADVKVAGNSNIQILTSENPGPIALVGGISGTGVYDRRLTLHFTPIFFVTQQGVIALEATVDGRSGTLYIKTVANSGKSPDGEWSIKGGTDDLANLHGQGTFIHVTPVLFTYEGQVHFDP